MDRSRRPHRRCIGARVKVLVDGQTLATPEMRRGIGLVFARLLREMACPEVSIRWHIAVGSLGDLDGLDPELAAALEPELLPGGDAPYGQRLQQVVDRVRPAWYWNPNPLMMNVAFPFGLQGVRTL